jgi:hypothetical protein
MAEKETYDAAREAMREVTDHPERTDTERLTRYLAGAAYHDEQIDSREKRDETIQEERS